MFDFYGPLQKHASTCVQVPCPRTRSTATIHLEMTDANGLVFTDDFALSFHMHFHRLLKWLVAAPYLACAAAVLSLRLDNIAAALPSFHRGGRATP